MEIKLIAVIGAGAMGQGVAQVSAVAGYQVVLNDLNEASLEKAMNGLRKNLGRLVEKGKMAEEEMNAALGRISLKVNLEEALKDADLVVECVFENLELKQKIFKDFEIYCKPGAILGSNTSAIPFTEVASVTSRGD